MILAVGVIGKTNEPLYIESFTDVDVSSLNTHFQIHYALDVIEERYSSPNKLTPAPDLYAGLLVSAEDTRIYGLITNTKAKLILVCKDSLPETRVQQFLRDLHELYSAAISNPFSQLSPRLDAPDFAASVSALVDQISTQT